MKLLLKGARVLDPANGIDSAIDVLVDNGVIARLDRDLPSDSATVVHLPHGLVICPGFIDMHVHLREPGEEHKETVATGTAAAVAGGFTAVACMPNTRPVNDHAGVTELILKQADAARQARVYPIGAISRGSLGEQLADVAELRSAGCVAISDDGRPVANALLMRRALEYAGMLGMTVIDHCEEPFLRGDGVAHEGYRAALLGLSGIPSAAEEIIVSRDVTLAELTASAVHIAHLSTRGSLRSVRAAKSRGVRVTCEVTPHHVTLTDEAVADYDTNAKMNPPLREMADRDGLLEGLADGSIDAIASDHAPHHYDEKQVEFERAPFGIVGLETAVSLSLDRLVHRQVLPLKRMVELFTTGPARILGIPGGGLHVGSAADLTILAPEVRTTVCADSFRSKSRNTPFNGWELVGSVAATIVGGEVRYVNDQIDGLQPLHNRTTR